jgi:phosphatidylglycerol:prolipoprotein diacylglycerol transferase
MQPLIPAFEPLRVPVTDSLVFQGPGLFAVVGFAAGAVLAVRKARRDGLDPGVIYRLLPWVAVGIILGGHLGYLLFYEPALLVRQPVLLLQLSRGQSAFGGFLGCTLVALWFYGRENRRLKAAGRGGHTAIDGWAYTDAYLYGFTLGWAICRIGCFSAHDHPGLETTFWLGVYGACPGGDPSIACHDMGLYEALWSLGMYGVFRRLDLKPRFPGFFTGWLFIAYGASRFPADFLRHPLVDTRYFGLTPAQYGSLAMLAIGAWILTRHQGRAPVRPAG